MVRLFSPLKQRKLMKIIIDVTDEQRELVSKYAIKQTIGGLSNLPKSDLAKASREHFQYTGLYGESAWHMFRYGHLNNLIKTLDKKNEELKPQRKGDGGWDDEITFRGVTRQVDIKTSHSSSDYVDNLDLIVPKREYHENTIYVLSFTIGNNRVAPLKTVLVGWAPNEAVTKVWRESEPDKLCVPVLELRNLLALKKTFADESQL